MPEKCVNVDISQTHAVTCREIADRAVTGWREAGIDEAQIQSVVNHEWPGIWPSFATEEEIQ